MAPNDAAASGGGGGEPTIASFGAAMAAQNARPAAPPQQAPANDNARPGRIAAPDDHPAAIAADGAEVEPEGFDAIDALQQEADAALDEQPVTDPLDEEVQYEVEGGEKRGMKMRDVIASLKEGIVPKELHGSLQFEVTDAGQQRVVSAAEMASGYLRMSHYTKGRQEIASERQEHKEFRDGFNQTMESAKKSPEDFRRTMRRMGFGEALYQAAALIAQDEHHLSQQPPEVATAIRARRAAEERVAELEERQRMNDETANANKARERQQRARRQVDELRPVAFKRMNIVDSPTAREYFDRNLRALLGSGERFSLEVCHSAAQATAEELGELAERHRSAAQPAGGSPAAQQLAAAQRVGAGSQRGAQPQQQQRGPLPARHGAAPAPVGNRAAASGGGTIKDFEKHMKAMRR
jgi:hypothetical protein